MCSKPNTIASPHQLTTPPQVMPLCCMNLSLRHSNTSSLLEDDSTPSTGAQLSLSRSSLHCSWRTGSMLLCRSFSLITISIWMEAESKLLAALVRRRIGATCLDLLARRLWGWDPIYHGHDTASKPALQSCFCPVTIQCTLVERLYDTCPLANIGSYGAKTKITIQALP